MKYGVKLLTVGFLLGFGCGFGDTGGNKMMFCPLGSERETRKVLGLGDASSLKMDELVSTIRKKGYSYEQASQSLKPRKCSEDVPLENLSRFKIYAGFGDAQTHTRNFLVLADEDGNLVLIEQVYAYIPP